MTVTIWILGIAGLILSVIGFIDTIKELKSFCRSGVMSGADFQREGAGATRSGLDLDGPKICLPFENTSSGLQAAPALSTYSENKGLKS